MSEQIKKEKKIFLEHLPHSKSGKQILWRECKGLGFDFIYGDLKGHIIIKSIAKNHLTLLYKDKTITITTSQLLQMGFCKLIGLYSNEYLHNVGDNVNDLLILKQIKLKSGNDDVKAYKYKCLIDGNIDTIREYDLDRKGHGCNVCSNHKCMKGVNDIATTHPHLVKYFKNIEDSYTHTYGSKDEVRIKCPSCGGERKITIQIFTTRDMKCPSCSDGVSYPNKFMFNVLCQVLDLNSFETEYSPNWVSRKFYDFYIPSMNLIIEMDGGLGHGRKTYGKGNKINNKSKEIDNYKDEQAKMHGIEVIRIDCDYKIVSKRFEFIKQNVLDSKLNNIFDLSNVNWSDIRINCLNSKIKETCDLWNTKLYTIKNIANLMKLSSNTISSYLKQGNDLGITCYIPKKFKMLVV